MLDTLLLSVLGFSDHCLHPFQRYALSLSLFFFFHSPLFFPFYSSLRFLLSQYLQATNKLKSRVTASRRRFYQYVRFSFTYKCQTSLWKICHVLYIYYHPCTRTHTYTLGHACIINTFCLKSCKLTSVFSIISRTPVRGGRRPPVFPRLPVEGDRGRERSTATRGDEAQLYAYISRFTQFSLLFKFIIEELTGALLFITFTINSGAAFLFVYFILPTTQRPSKESTKTLL